MAKLRWPAFLRRLRWLDGSPMSGRVEPYRSRIFSAFLDTFEKDGRPRYNLILTGRAKKNWKLADLALASLFAGRLVGTQARRHRAQGWPRRPGGAAGRRRCGHARRELSVRRLRRDPQLPELGCLRGDAARSAPDRRAAVGHVLRLDLPPTRRAAVRLVPPGQGRRRPEDAVQLVRRRLHHRPRPCGRDTGGARQSEQGQLGEPRLPSQAATPPPRSQVPQAASEPADFERVTRSATTFPSGQRTSYTKRSNRA